MPLQSREAAARGGVPELERLVPRSRDNPVQAQRDDAINLHHRYYFISASKRSLISKQYYRKALLMRRLREARALEDDGARELLQKRRARHTISVRRLSRARDSCSSLQRENPKDTTGTTKRSVII